MCLSISMFLLICLVIFGLGWLAGWQEKKERCDIKIRKLLENGFTYEDENNGDC